MFYHEHSWTPVLIFGKVLASLFETLLYLGNGGCIVLYLVHIDKSDSFSLINVFQEWIRDLFLRFFLCYFIVFSVCFSFSGQRKNLELHETKEGILELNRDVLDFTGHQKSELALMNSFQEWIETCSWGFWCYFVVFSEYFMFLGQREHFEFHGTKEGIWEINEDILDFT